jgi:hypothetical protein
MKKTWMLIVMLAILSCVAVGGAGCAADRATVDHRAAVMSGLADKINSGTADDLRTNALDAAWVIENERRAAVNLSDAYHWRGATYKHPAGRPTTLPWTPQDDVPAEGGK